VPQGRFLPRPLAQDGPLVLAAASLQESMSAAADRWAARGHPHPVLSFAASSALARQIEARACRPVRFGGRGLDGRRGARRARGPGHAGLVSGQCAGDRGPGGQPGEALSRARISALVALGTGRLAMADPDAVPAGRYGKAALTALGVWAQVEPRVARAESVRGALALARGAAPLGIVYATDARADPAVRIAGVFPAAMRRSPIRSRG
jgi:molybdate transport system substrate-binding protein